MSDSKAASFPVVLPRPIPGSLRTAFLLLAAVGAVVFGWSVMIDPARAWRGYLMSAMFFTGISLAGVTWAATTRLANGRFARPLVRLMESLSAFQWVGFLLIVAYVIWGAPQVYSWVGHPRYEGDWWLTLNYLRIRDIAALFVLVALMQYYVRTALMPDAALLKGRVSGGLQKLHAGVAGGFGGSDLEMERHRKLLLRLSPAVIILFTLVWTLLTVDLVMSIDPLWVSTMFGPIGFMSAFLGAMCCVAVMVVGNREGELTEVFQPNVLHDVGKLIFAFSIFWAYINFAQYLVIWYGHLPEETHWFHVRLNDTWRAWTCAVPILVWFTPFALMMTLAAKKNPNSLRFFALVVLLGLWLQMLVQIGATPSPDHLTLGLPEIGPAVGMLGLFAFMVSTFHSRFGVIPAVDPYGPPPAH